VPLHGDWKTLVRFHDGDRLAASAVYFPRDAAIPAREIPAEATSTRPFVNEVELLQRERKDDVAGWLWTTAGAVVLFLYLAFLGALAWGVGRVARHDRDGDGAPPSERVEAPGERFSRPVPTVAS
jgi:hypothetical protein